MPTPVDFQQLPTWWQQPALTSFKARYLASGARPLVFVGAGLSRSAGLPNWSELLTRLASIADATNKAGNTYTKQTAEFLGTPDEGRFQKAGSLLKEALGSHWRPALEKILVQEVPKPSKAHTALAQLRRYHIVTTNYDALLEQAFFETSGTTLPKCHPWHRNLQNLERSESPFLFKIHGDITDPDSQIVLTTEEYEALYGRINEPHSDLFPHLQSILRTASVILFVGFGHDDVFVSRYFEWALRETGKDSLFAILPRRGDPEYFAKKTAKLRADLGIQVISYSPFEHHDELSLLLEYIHSSAALDDRFRASAKIRRPSVVMLYCGGTIGGSRDNGESRIHLNVRKSRFDPELKVFADDFLTYYRPLRAPHEHHNDEIDILWEVMPAEYQMFSENATPDFWNQLLKKVEFIIFKYFAAAKFTDHQGDLRERRLIEVFREERAQRGYLQELTEKEFLGDILNRYVLGIIIMHGTDTLSFTANALSFGLQHLPCPIVVTGANEPPDDPGKDVLSNIQAQSDSWRNLANSLYFLQAFGHRLTEVFVCFGDTVHHAANLRKHSVDTIPFSRELIAGRAQEPFLFRNMSFMSEYMFKLIGGIYCNNYYPKDQIPFRALIGPESKYRNMRHIRPNPFAEDEGRGYGLQRGEFGDVVRFLAVSPCFPRMNVEDMLETGSRNMLETGSRKEYRVRAVVVESYPSGTYPSGENSSFAELLSGLEDKAIPIVLISLYGMVPTQEEYELKGKRIEVVRLFGVVVETALPLLSFVLGAISNDKWDKAGTFAARTLLLRQQLRDYFKYRPNIISNELRLIMDPAQLKSEWEKSDGAMKDLAEKRSERFATRSFTDLGRLGRAVDEINGHSDREEERRTLLLPRNDYLGLIDELALSHFERIGTGPQGYQTLCSVGFRLGHMTAKKYLDTAIHNNISVWPHRQILSAQSAEHRSLMLDTASEALAQAIERLRVSGLVDITLTQKEKEERWLVADDHAIGFSVTIRRHSEVGAQGEKYSGQSYLDKESQLFDDMRSGNRGTEFLREEYDRLLGNTFEHDTRSSDWLVLGILRGFVASIAQAVYINVWTMESIRDPNSPIYRRALQEAAKCRLTFSDLYSLAADVFFANP
jgi:L-asparaginase/Glu-tRNA(Gln) amidotransferase subunit D